MLIRKLANRLLTLSVDQKPRIFEGTVEQEDEQMMRHNRKRSDDSSLDNERITLEWTLSTLLSEEGGTDSEEKERLLSIRMLQKQLESL